MIIKLYDSNKEEINPGDIILVKYENEKVVFLGELAWRDPEYDLILTDNKDDYISFPPSTAKCFERICSKGNRPELDDFLGRLELKNIKAREAFYDML